MTIPRRWPLCGAGRFLRQSSPYGGEKFFRRPTGARAVIRTSAHGYGRIHARVLCDAQTMRARACYNYKLIYCTGKCTLNARVALMRANAQRARGRVPGRAAGPTHGILGPAMHTGLHTAGRRARAGWACVWVATPQAQLIRPAMGVLVCISQWFFYFSLLFL